MTVEKMKELMRDWQMKNARCPVSNGLPTAMTQSAFSAVCAAIQKKTDDRGNVRSMRCISCDGVPPDEVKIVTMEEQMKPDEAAEECSLCGIKKMLKNAYGQRVCATCSVVLSAAKNRPKTVEHALEKFHGVQEVQPASSGNDTGVLRVQLADVTAERDELAERIKVLEEMAVPVEFESLEGNTLPPIDAGTRADLLEIAWSVARSMATGEAVACDWSAVSALKTLAEG